MSFRRKQFRTGWRPIRAHNMPHTASHLAPPSLPKMERVFEDLKRVADLPATALVSEEDVKNKVVLPVLRALGYDDSDFNYERRTGRGYVDIVVERFPSGIIVEAKASRTRLARHKEQLEGYVFHKHRQDRTTLAILTDGTRFNLYGVTGPLWKGGLDKYFVMSFRRADLRSRVFAGELSDLCGRESNQKAAVREAIASYKQKRKDRSEQIQPELTKLKEERRRIEAKIRELEAELRRPGTVTAVSKQADSGETADFPTAAVWLKQKSSGRLNG